MFQNVYRNSEDPGNVETEPIQVSSYGLCRDQSRLSTNNTPVWGMHFVKNRASTNSMLFSPALQKIGIPNLLDIDKLTQRESFEYYLVTNIGIQLF